MPSVLPIHFSLHVTSAIQIVFTYLLIQRFEYSSSVLVDKCAHRIINIINHNCIIKPVAIAHLMQWVLVILKINMYCVN